MFKHRERAAAAQPLQALSSAVWIHITHWQGHLHSRHCGLHYSLDSLAGLLVAAQSILHRTHVQDVPPPSPSALATLRSKRLTHDQCLEVFNKYVKWCRHQASPAELRNSSKAFVSMCTLVKKQAPKTAATGFKTSAQASSEMQNLLEELQSQVIAGAASCTCTCVPHGASASRQCLSLCMLRVKVYVTCPAGACAIKHAPLALPGLLM